MQTSLGTYQQSVAVALDKLAEKNIIPRIWEHDYTVWSSSPKEVTNRLGWLRIADGMRENLAEMQALVDSVRGEGYTHAVLLGMGGSSLAPEVFRKTYGVAAGHLDLAVLDSTDPGAVLAHAQKLDFSKALFIVSTKSGGTVETLSFFKYFYNQVLELVGQDQVGAHFVAITDGGSKLDALASQYAFRATFRNDPNIGGRYSALSYFGLLPAALIGVDIARLLDNAQAMARDCESTGESNPGAQLGVIMGDLARAGRDKVTFVLSPTLVSFGDWVEQLIAESIGKDGKGILPVVGEAPGSPADYGTDRLFVHLQLAGEDADSAAVAALESAGQPVIRMELSDPYALGGQFFLWEMATAVAGHWVGIQPFDQPNVESAKIRAREMVAAYMETGALPAQKAALTDGSIAVYGDIQAASAGEALVSFLSQAQAGDYLSLQAYLQPTTENDAVLNALRVKLFNGTSAVSQLAVTLGYGPRFLHSTGQLHKGDAGNGLFIQFTDDPAADVAIPDEAGKSESTMTFGVLKMAQALGDAQALQDNHRRLIRFHLGGDVIGGLQRLIDALP